MSETPGIDAGKSTPIKDSAAKSQSKQQVRDTVREAIAQWKSQGIQDWEILDTWANLAYQQGNYVVADTLETAAYELGKPIE